MFQTNRYQVPNKNLFATDDKVRFYIGLPSMEVLMVAFEHVSSHVTRQTQSWVFLIYFRGFQKME